MKKILLCALMVCVAGVSKAQGFRLGLQGGVNVSYPTNLDAKPGYSVGVKAELSILSGMYLETGVSLSAKPWGTDQYFLLGSNSTGTAYSAMPHYVEVPVHVGYKLSLGGAVKLMGSAGPYVSYGAFGKEKVITEVFGKSVTATNRNNIFREKGQELFDWGLGARLGVELFNHLQVSVAYNAGMKHISNRSPSQMLEGLKSSKNRVLSLTLGYMF